MFAGSTSICLQQTATVDVDSTSFAGATYERGLGIVRIDARLRPPPAPPPPPPPPPPYCAATTVPAYVNCMPPMISTLPKTICCRGAYYSAYEICTGQAPGWCRSRLAW